MPSISKAVLVWLFKRAGITINGPEPWDIQVHDDRFFRRVLFGGSLGLGESYQDGWWDCEKLDLCFERLLRSWISRIGAFTPSHLAELVRSKLVDHGAASNSHAVGEAHYDLGNDLFVAMLGKSMAYTCGYWKNATTLDEAEFAKLDLVCRKIHLRPKDRVLDIGCGFGSFAKFASTHHDAFVHGITISTEQLAWGKQWCQGLPVLLEDKDYREVEGQFDHIVSIGMFEHVEPQHYEEYFRVVAAQLKPGGLVLLHTIGNPARFAGGPDPWIRKYIFPTGKLPTRSEIERSIGMGLVIRDWHEFPFTDYDRTLMSWNHHVQNAWPQLSARYDMRFKRMWEYYPQGCAAAFRTGRLRLWQIVLSRPGEHADLKPVR